VTLSDLGLMAIITHYFTQYDSFQSQLYEIHWS